MAAGDSAWPVLVSNQVHDSIEWYRSVFTLVVAYRNETEQNSRDVNYAVLDLSGGGFHLALARDMDMPAGQGACVVHVDDFDGVLIRARAQGATFYIEPGTIPTGARTFGILDPDGNHISIVER